MTILEQVGRLLLNAVPVIILVYLLYFFLKANLFRPLERVLAERNALIAGAKKEAEAHLAAAQEKERGYQDALKRARAEVYAEQDVLRRRVLDERAALLREARSRAGERIKAAKVAIHVAAAEARALLERDAEGIAAEIASAILSPRPPASPGAREAR